MKRRAKPDERHCVICRLYITSPQWRPVCCEVCWDSYNALERRLMERLQSG